MSLSGSELGSRPASIVVKNLSLVVPYYAQPERVPSSSWLGTLLGAATSIPRRRFATLLDQVTFSIEEGERVALIGRNGAGKSTLLRTLAGAFQPTSGGVEVVGSTQALLSVGLGFNSEATVQENIYLRATALGIRPAAVRAMIGPVLEFSELSSVANRRLMTLSSGQKMRLGFAISTMVQHDVLLLDEWLGTGDAQFVRRAQDRMMDRVNGSKIVVIASHKISLLKSLCTRGILLEGGRLVFDGDISEALAEYRKLYPVGSSRRSAADRAVARRRRRRLLRTTEMKLRKELEPQVRKELAAKLKRRLMVRIRKEVEEELRNRTARKSRRNSDVPVSPDAAPGSREGS